MFRNVRYHGHLSVYKQPKSVYKQQDTKFVLRSGISFKHLTPKRDWLFACRTHSLSKLIREHTSLRYSRSLPDVENFPSLAVHRQDWRRCDNSFQRTLKRRTHVDVKTILVEVTCVDMFGRLWLLPHIGLKVQLPISLPDFLEVGEFRLNIIGVEASGAITPSSCVV